MDIFVKVLPFILFVYLPYSQTTWWSLGLSGAYTPIDQQQQLTKQSLLNCDDLAILKSSQRKLCHKDKKIVDVVSKGAEVSISECQYQFQHRRWNCSIFNSTKIFGNISDIKSRETAFIYALFSAGVMHTVTKACALGALNHCGCDNRVRNRHMEDSFKWGGCSDNIRYSRKFTRIFVDESELRDDEQGLMNLWNNEAGRRAIKNNINRICKCHGVSGSCTLKICFRRTRPFREIGTYLKQKFDGANRVKLNKRRRRLKPLNRRLKKPRKEDLVYLSESPNFCEQNLTYGSLGTHGRECNVSSHNIDGCTLMCCGRGYYTIVKKVVEDCDCKFFWCCYVKCNKCQRVLEQHHCN